MDEFDYQDYILLYGSIRCDGVVFHPDAFKSSIGKTVPVVHGDGMNMTCLGRAILEQDTFGIIAKCKFWDTFMGESARLALLETDDLSLSCPIYRVKRDGKDVISGDIRRVNVIPKSSAFTYADNQKD